MYFSQLKLNLRNNSARKDLGNIYELHRTLSHAFEEDYENSKMLFHTIDTVGGKATVLVYSKTEPNWDYLNENYLLEPASYKEVNFPVSEKDVFSFKMRANPTEYKYFDGLKKRVGIYNYEEQMKWLSLKSEKYGFKIIQTEIINEGISKGNKDISMLSVLFNGYLQITDKELFLKALEDGIGRGKRFGFGMLLISNI